MLRRHEIHRDERPPLNGLVLAGGKSKRMGRDKGLLRWHGKAQRYFLADLLGTYCAQTFISCRPEQTGTITAAGYHALPDCDIAEGQYRAILSAMAAYPGSAWLVVACDLPLLDAEALSFLIEQRDTRALATAFVSEAGGLPEPLAAIWEPRSQAMLLQKLSEGITCPRKALIGSSPHVKLVNPPQPQVILNVNTPETADVARGLITIAKATNRVA